MLFYDLSFFLKLNELYKLNNITYPTNFKNSKNSMNSKNFMNLMDLTNSTNSTHSATLSIFFDRKWFQYSVFIANFV